MNKLNDQQLIEDIRTRLDSSIAHLDPSIGERLDSMRRQAIALESVSVSAEEESIVLNVRSKLDESLSVAPEIKARLDQIRQQAIARLKTPAPESESSLFTRAQETLQALFANNRLAMPASVFATACVMVTVVSLFYVSRPPGTLPLEDEISLIASADDIELYENLDFYLWLAENDFPI